MNPAPPVIKTRMAAAEAIGCGMFRAWGPFPRDGACATPVRCSPCEGRWSRHLGDPRNECRRKREAKAYRQQGDRRPGAILVARRTLDLFTRGGDVYIMRPAPQAPRAFGGSPPATADCGG